MLNLVALIGSFWSNVFILPRDQFVCSLAFDQIVLIMTYSSTGHIDCAMVVVMVVVHYICHWEQVMPVMVVFVVNLVKLVLNISFIDFIIFLLFLCFRFGSIIAQLC